MKFSMLSILPIALLAAEISFGDQPRRHSEFTLRQTSLAIRQVDLSAALVSDAAGIPRLDGAKLESTNPLIVERLHSAVVLENPFVRVTILPEMGRVYSLVNKTTGHEQFWTNAVAKPLAGQRNDAGWWMVWGGVEYVIPRGEHGTTWALPWQYRVTADNRRKKAVRMEVLEPTTRLRQTLEIALFRDRAEFEARITIANTGREAVMFSFWINPMWAPGGRGEITANTELIVPCRSVRVAERDFNAWMLGDRTQEFERNPLRWVKYWKSIGDLQADGLTGGFYSAFSHDANEGVVRVFDPKRTPGMNMWTWGFPPPPASQRQYSFQPNLGYVEMWGGSARDFSDESLGRIGPGRSWQSIEWMYAYQGTGGLTEANRDAAVRFHIDSNAQKLEFAAYVTAPRPNSQITVRSGRRTLFEERADLAPDRPFLKVFDLPASDRGQADVPTLILRYQGKQLIRTPATPKLPVKWGNPYLPGRIAE